MHWLIWEARVAGEKGDGGSGVGSDRGELKRLLRLAADKPVHMAFALGADGKAVLKLDKLKPPRSLEKGLKEDVEGSRNHRFGVVTIDAANPEIVTFVVNKAVSGFARKLVFALKGTGFKTVRLTTEDGAEVESHAEPDEEEAGPTALPGAKAVSAPGLVDEPKRPVAGVNAGLDVAALTQQLTGLVKQMMAVIVKDPSQKAALAEFAIDAQASLKQGDLARASAGIEMLRQAIGAGGGAGNGAGGPSIEEPPGERVAGQGPAAGTLRKARVAWTAARAKVDVELGKLSDAITVAAQGEPGASGIEDKFFRSISPLLTKLDDRLGDVLERASQATGDERQSAIGEAQQEINRCQGLVVNDPGLKMLANNPFLPVQAGKILDSTLTTLARVVA